MLPVPAALQAAPLAARPELQLALPMAQLRAPEDREEEAMAPHLPAAEAPPNAVALRWAVVQHWAQLALQVAAQPAVRLEAAQRAAQLADSAEPAQSQQP